MRMHVLAFPIAGLWSGNSEIARDPHVLAFLNHRAVARWFRDRARYSPRLTSREIISPTFPAKTSRDLPTTSNNGTSYNAAETIKGRYLVTQRVTNRQVCSTQRLMSSNDPCGDDHVGEGSTSVPTWVTTTCAVRVSLSPVG